MSSHIFCSGHILFVDLSPNVNLGQVNSMVGQVKLDAHLPKGQVV